MTIQYTIAIDHDDDGAFTELGDAVTTEVLAAHWRLGMPRPYAHTASPAQAQVTVRNRDGAFSPERSRELTGKALRIYSDDGSTTRTHFTGFIARVEPEAGAHGSQRATIIAEGYGAQLAQHPAQLPAQVNRRADQAINALLKNAVFRYAVLDGYCILDRAAHNVIDATRLFPAQAIETQLEPGKSTFAYLGDDWDDSLMAAQALDILARCEGGRFFFDREGRAVFHNRHHALVTEAISAAFSDDVAGLSYRYGDEHINRVQVRSRSRAVGAPNTVLWSLAQPLLLARKSTTRLTVHYRVADENTDSDDSTGSKRSPGSQEVAALEIVPPRRNQHYAALEEPQAVSVRIVQAGFRAATLEIRNESRRVLVLNKLELRGTPLHLGAPFTVTEDDALNQTLYGLRTLTLEVPALSAVDEAAAVGRYEMLRRGTPRGTVREFSILARAHPEAALSLTLMDKITLHESQTGHQGTYIIVAEEHRVDQGGARHVVTYGVEPDEAQRFFVLDRHALNSSRILAPR